MNYYVKKLNIEAINQFYIGIFFFHLFVSLINRQQVDLHLKYINCLVHFHVN